MCLVGLRFRLFALYGAYVFVVSVVACLLVCCLLRLIVAFGFT